MKTLKEIKQMPTTHNMVHESIYKSHATLQLVKDMLKRGDSSESILMVVEDVYEGHDKDEKIVLELNIQRDIMAKLDKRVTRSDLGFKPLGTEV